MCVYVEREQETKSISNFHSMSVGQCTDFGKSCIEDFWFYKMFWCHGNRAGALNWTILLSPVRSIECGH